MAGAGHIAVVGGGVVGLSLVREALARGHEVTCIAPSAWQADAASRAAGAMLGAFGEVTAHEPHDRSGAETAVRIQAARSYGGWLDALQQEAGRPVTHGTGTFIVANAASRDDVSNLDEIERTAHANGERAERVDTCDCFYLSPHPSWFPHAILFLPDEGFVDSGQLMSALEVATSRHAKYKYVDQEAVDIEIEGRRVRLADGATVAADHIIIACGTASTRLLRRAGLVPPGFPRLVGGKGSYAILEGEVRVPYVLRTPNRDFACGLHIIPRGGSRIYVGATNRVELDDDFGTRPSLAELQGLLYNVAHQFHTDLRRSAFVRAGSGSRPYSLDGKMIVGALAGTAVSVATGTYRNGILLAPWIARAVLDEIETGVTASADFSPNHRAGIASSRAMEQIVERAFDDLMAYLLEPDGFMPFDRQQQMSRAMRAFFLALMAEGAERQTFDRIHALFRESYAPELIPYMFERLAAGDTATLKSETGLDSLDFQS